MPPSNRFHSLLAQSVVWIIGPISVVVLGTLFASVFTFQGLVSSLLLDRDRQLAVLSAARVSDVLEGYARVLEALAVHPDIVNAQPGVQQKVLEDAGHALRVFTAGVVIVDRRGRVQAAAPEQVVPQGTRIADAAYFQLVRHGHARAFSEVVVNAGTGQDMIVIAVPIVDDAGFFVGALLGAMNLRDAPLGQLVRKLVVGDDGFAYLVDGQGRIIFHPEPQYIGADFTNRPYVRRVVAGEAGADLGVSPSGERLVIGFAPVEVAGWGLVVREPWQAVVAPVWSHGLLFIVIGLVISLVAAGILWFGVGRITTPVRLLATQAAKLPAGEAVEPVAASGILELDALAQAFRRMADEVETYRAGLRRYVGAMTWAQEEERRRLARELHDETAQSLLAVARRLELHQASETDPARLAKLADLQGLVRDTLAEVRRISRNLRPLVLEDLGLIAALRTLARGAREDASAPAFELKLEVAGHSRPLSGEQELALYRITQEALHNIRRHAQASRARIRLMFAPDHVRLDIHDDGVGFHVPDSFADLARRGHFGLMGIQERVWAVGGWLSVEAAPGAGTRLTVTVPSDRGPASLVK